MDSFDLYDDLQVLQEQGKHRAQEDFQWKKKYETALGTIEKLQFEKKELSKKIKLLEINFASLLDTARAEVKRKDCQIAELRNEKDDLCFRRNTHTYKHSNYDTTNHLGQIKNLNLQKSCDHNEWRKDNGPRGSLNPVQKESDRMNISNDEHERHVQKSTNQKSLHNDDLNCVFLNQDELLKHKKNENISKSIAKNFKYDLYAPTVNATSNSEKMLEKEVLNDAKELRKRKQSDLKDESEAESNKTLKTVNEKSMLFDALFDDLSMNKEISENSYSGKEANQSDAIFEIGEKETQIGNWNPNSDNMFPDVEQFNTKKMKNKAISNFEKHDLSNKFPTSEPINITGSDDENIFKTSLSNVESNTNSPSIETITNENEEVSFLEKNCMSNPKKINSMADDNFTQVIGENNNDYIKRVYKIENVHNHDRIASNGEKTQSIKLTSDISEKRNFNEVKDSFRHKVRHSKNSSLSKVHCRGKETYEQRHVNYPSKAASKPRNSLKFDIQTEDKGNPLKDFLPLSGVQKDENNVLNVTNPCLIDNTKFYQKLDGKYFETNPSSVFGEESSRILSSEKCIIGNNLIQNLPVTNLGSFFPETQMNDIHMRFDDLKSKYSLNDKSDADASGSHKDQKASTTDFSTNHGKDIGKSADVCFKEEINQTVMLKKHVSSVLFNGNLTQSDFKLNETEKKCNKLENENVMNPSETDMSKKQNASIKKLQSDYISNQIHQPRNQPDKNKQTTEPIENEIEKSEYIKMLPLLVEEEPEDVTTRENITKILKISKRNETPKQENYAIENRIHHKKRMIQNSRSLENARNSLCMQSNITPISVVTSVCGKIVEKSLPFNSTTILNDNNTKHSDLSSFTSNVEHTHFKKFESKECSYENVISSSDRTERYKKKILKKYENSNKVFEKNVENNLSTTTSSSFTSNSNSTHTPVLVCQNTDILPNSMPKKAFETTCKTNVLELSEKQRFPIAKETTNINITHNKSVSGERVCKSYVVKDISIRSAIENINAEHISENRIVNMPNHIDTSSTITEQSNEVSSQGVINEDIMIEPICVEKNSKATVDLKFDKCCVVGQNTIHFNHSNQRRKILSDLTDQKDEENISKIKKFKPRESKSPYKLKSLPSNKSLFIQTENGNKKKIVLDEKPLVCEINCNVIDQNIFTNDERPNDKNLPAICNDNDIEYLEIDNRLRSMFQSPTYNSPAGEIDSKYDNTDQRNNYMFPNHTINEALNRIEKLQCDTSSSSRKISVGSNDYIIETIDAHVANVFVTRKKCKKRRKLTVAAV